MNYPNGPYGPGLPGQPRYPQQAGYQQGYQPGYPSGYPRPGGFQPPPVSPSGGTAATAGALALLGGLLHGGFGAMALLSSLTDKPDVFATRTSSHIGILILAMSVIGGLLILAGGFLLISRKMAGRWLIAAGCVPIFAFGLMAFLAASTQAHTVVGVLALPMVIFPVATVVLSFLPSTTRWLHTKRNPVPPQPYSPYPPYRG